MYPTYPPQSTQYYPSYPPSSQSTAYPNQPTSNPYPLPTPTSAPGPSTASFSSSSPYHPPPPAQAPYPSYPAPSTATTPATTSYYPQAPYNPSYSAPPASSGYAAPPPPPPLRYSTNAPPPERQSEQVNERGIGTKLLKGAGVLSAATALYKIGKGMGKRKERHHYQRDAAMFCPPTVEGEAGMWMGPQDGGYPDNDYYGLDDAGDDGYY